MAQVTLDAPLTLNPLAATRIVLRHSVIEHGPNVVQVAFDLVDANGAVLEQRRLTLTGAAIQTWIANQESTLLTRLLNRLGVTGTIT